MALNIQFLISILGINVFFLPIWFTIKYHQYKKGNCPQTVRAILLFALAEYFVCLAAVTIVPLPFAKAGTPYLNLDFFHQTYYNFLSAYYHTSNRTLWNETENLIGNIVLFLPLGFLLPLLFHRYKNLFNLLIFAASCSFIIEAIQYYISINWGYNRIADIDDLVLNTFGALLGYIAYHIRKLFKKVITSKL